MSHIRLVGGAIAALGLIFAIGSSSDAQEPSSGSSLVVLLSVQDAIGPATSRYIQDGIEKAQEQGAALVVLELDTPGGLDSSMRDIIKAILASPVPVATYVSPQGARAASAGTYILYASHIAAMAPATTTGAATPISIGGTETPSPPVTGNPSDENGNADESPEGAGSGTEESGQTGPTTASERKAVNDAVSYIRGLAERRGRNADWAERAVRYADSINARVALELGVVDIVATSVDDLVRQVNGRQVLADGRVVTIDTNNPVYERFEADWRTKLLSILTNPEVAYMLLLLGIYGLIFEGYNPGAVLPGVVGAISLLLALFAFQILPVNYAGLALIILGVVLMAAEFFVPSFGALGFGGIAAFVFGSLILIDTDVPGFSRPTGLIATVATLGGAGLLGLIWIAMRARRRPVVSGSEQLLHGRAEALEDFDSDGTVWIHGERWRATTSVPVKKGQKLRVTNVDGLVLNVEPAQESSQAPLASPTHTH